MHVLGATHSRACMQHNKDEVLPKLKRRNINSVVVVSSSLHIPGRISTLRHAKKKRACKYYRSHIVSRLRRLGGLNVSVVNNGFPDEDFLLLASAPTLVPGGGGFAWRAAQCAKRFGGTVLGLPQGWAEQDCWKRSGCASGGRG